jgi:hypothetical protein
LLVCRLGAGEFTDPAHKPNPETGASRSIFFPDEAINSGHPRFKLVEIFFSKNESRFFIELQLILRFKVEKLDLNFHSIEKLSITYCVAGKINFRRSS